jgi:FkbM family methyltransferase
MLKEMSGTYPMKFYATLLRVRPAQLCSVIKKLLRVRRRYVRSTTGHTFWLDPVSVFGLHLMTEGMHEPQMSKLFALVLRPGDCVIDIGGNEGYFSVLAASLMPQGRVYCIEPQTRLQPVIRKNIDANKSHQIKLHHVAFSSGDSDIEIFLRPDSINGASSMFPHWKLGSKKEKIHAITLDRFFEQERLERVRLIKMDCEGAEYLIVEGGKSVFARQAVDFIALEYHTTICGIEKCRHTHEVLKSCGYQLTKVHGQCIYHLAGLETSLTPLGNLQVDCDWVG